MSLFICSTHCESCTETETCTLKEQVKSSVTPEIENASNELNQMLKERLEKLTPQVFLELSRIDTFNFLSSVQILHEKGESLTISEIAKIMEAHISQKKPEINDDDLIFEAKIFALIMGISKKVHDFLNDNCENACSSCFILEECDSLKKKMP